MAAYRPIYTKEKEWVNTGTADGEIMVFRPTMEEFSNFSKYIETIERSRAHLSSGVCKVIPPPGWHPRPSKNPSDYSDLNDFVIHCPVKERIEGGSSTGCYVKNNTVYRKEMRVGDFRRMALSKQFRPPKPNYDLTELERHFWRNLLHHEPIYGADTPGSIYDPGVSQFNMNGLGTILDLLKEQELEIKGVNTVFLYFGMWKTMFPWHVEDMDLYSINYLHFGEPKFWYAIPPSAAAKFERLAAQRFPDGLQICKAFLRHKVYIVSPSVLRTNGVPFGSMVQYPGEFMITFPRGYHMGFNLGYNCAESTNFALERWIDYGKNAVLCYCRNDCVEIDMRPFMEKYRPNEYKEWLDYWYGEAPTPYSPKTRAMSVRRGSTSSQPASKSGSVGTNNSDDSLPVPCTKRQKAIFKARKLMDALWANKPVDLYAEKVHNSRSGRLYPHCAVCQFFLQRSVWMKGTPVEKVPKKSKRFVSDQMFEKDFRMDTLDLGRSKLIDDQLRECSNCKVVVHVGCYPSQVTLKQEQKDYRSFPSTSSSSSSAEWLCERCDDPNDVLIRTASCALCELRSGALMRKMHCVTQNIGFVHVICALMDPNTRFLRLQQNDRVGESKTPQHQQNQQQQCPPSRPALAQFNSTFLGCTTTMPQKHRPSTLFLPISKLTNIAYNGFRGTSSDCPPLTPPDLSPQSIDVPPENSTKYFEFDDSRQIDSGLADTLSTSECANAITPKKSDPDSAIAVPTYNCPPLHLPPNNSPSLALELSSAKLSPAVLPPHTPFCSYSASLPHVRSCNNDNCVPLQYDRATVPTADEYCTTPEVPNVRNNGEERPTLYQCEVCGHQSEHLVRCAICVEEKELGAKLRFHVTCAPLADVIFERREFPGALPICVFHHSAQFSGAFDPTDSRVFELKQRVVVDLNEETGDDDEEEEEKKDERLIGYGLIYSISEHLYATVDFLDGTSSSEVFPSDIVDCECKMFGCNGGAHIPGSLVYVNWEEDRKTYQAYYRGQSPRKKYKVKLYPPLSFEMKERRRAEEAAENGGETPKNKRRDDEVEVTSEMIFRRDDLFPEYIRQALLKRKSGESIGQSQHGRNS
ncbi:hypothetical protein niasHT_008115 [Heterodera trifolii]|uniref:[Histone H3]-trimethyl-L-lysine(9) demethylase n=1 Tax=Heterodera trifolii TaxID=157864 RepID=A0ABD2M0F4_9BILA